MVRFASLLVVAVFTPVVGFAQVSGDKLYAAKCAKCHGTEGQGVATQYDQPLTGERSVPQLAKYIAKSMPPEDPGSVKAPEAEAIAGFLHGAFYSKEARERNKPPRVELSRLTVNQYRQTLGDLVGSFRWKNHPEGKTGLKGEYFTGRNFTNDKRSLERNDGQVDFDFGTEVPKDSKISAPDFSIRWSGMVAAPTTGDYDFVIRTDHACRLWVNDDRKPLIDAWVKSGTDTEFQGSIFLVAGRHYLLRLEFSKAKQGVNDNNKGKPIPVKPARISLAWKPPGQAATVIPARHLAPVTTAEQFISSVPFPPDDRSLGWERGTTVSREWDEAVTEGTLQATAYILKNLDDLAKVKPGQADRAAKIKAFVLTLTERAFRRPLSDAEKRIFVERHFDAVKDEPEAAVKRALLLVLKSPRFLYREPAGTPSGHAVASRLSYMLLDSMPDEGLLRAAAEGRLAKPEQVRAEAERMLKDPRAEAKLMGFLNHWLGMEHHGELSKNPERFPGFDPALVSDLQSSLDIQLRTLLRSPTADYRRLFTSDEFYLNAKLAKFYGAEVNGPEFVPTKLDPGIRAGVITHPYVLAMFAYNAESSPIHRGVFLTRGILGQTLKPPSEAFTPLPAALHPKLTTRERTDLQTSPRNCQSCHAIINPLGFTLEQFDAVGKFREQERDKPVNATGSYVTRTGDTATFRGPVEFSKFLVDSPEAVDSFTQKLFHHLVQQPLRAYGTSTQADLSLAFKNADYNIRKLAVECLLKTVTIPPTAGVQAASRKNEGS